MRTNKTKLTQEEAENALSVLTFEAKNSIKGGCGHCEGWEEEGAIVYSQEEYSYLSSQSLWAGGNVCGIGYVPSQTSKSETTTDAPMGDGMDSTIDDTTMIPDESGTTGEPEIIPDDPMDGDDTNSTENPDSTTDDVSTDTIDEPTKTVPNEPQTTGEPESDEDGTRPSNNKGNGQEATPDVVWHTWEDMEAMMADGTWTGGFVEGHGYFLEQSVIFSSSNLGEGNYSTYLEFMRGSESAWWESMIEAGVGSVPGIGDAMGYMKDRIENAEQELQGDLLEKGYTSDSQIYTDMHTDHMKDITEYRVWDARTGNLISSRIVFNPYGL